MGIGVGDTLEPVEGTASRDLWKLSCWELAKDVGENPQERKFNSIVSTAIL